MLRRAIIRHALVLPAALLAVAPLSAQPCPDGPVIGGQTFFFNFEILPSEEEPQDSCNQHLQESL